jgi:hypothetical protein
MPQVTQEGCATDPAKVSYGKGVVLHDETVQQKEVGEAEVVEAEEQEQEQEQEEQEQGGAEVQEEVKVNEGGECERGVGVCQVMVEVGVLANEKEAVVEVRACVN